MNKDDLLKLTFEMQTPVFELVAEKILSLKDNEAFSVLKFSEDLAKKLGKTTSKGEPDQAGVYNMIRPVFVAAEAANVGKLKRGPNGGFKKNPTPVAVAVVSTTTDPVSKSNSAELNDDMEVVASSSDDDDSELDSALKV